MSLRQVPALPRLREETRGQAADHGRRHPFREGTMPGATHGRHWLTVTIAFIGSAAAIGATVIADAITAVTIAAVTAVLVVWVPLQRNLNRASASDWDPVVLLIPITLAIRAVNANVSVIALGGLLVWALARSRHWPQMRDLAVPTLLALVALLTWLPPASQSVLWASVLAGLTLIVAANGVTRRRFVSSLADGIGIYLLVNVVGFYVLGLVSQSALTRQAGFTASGDVRAFFPLTTSLNLPPALAACYMAALPLLLQAGVLKRLLRVLFLLSAIVVLVGADGRTALVVAACIALAVMALQGTLRRAAVWVVAIALFLPFYFKFVASLLTHAIDALATAIPALNRSGVGGDFETLNGREYIWSAALAYWPRLDSLTHIIGAGYPGHARTGASESYAFLFSSFTDTPTAATTHSSLLQQLFDGGILAGFGLLLVVLLMLRRWSTAPGPESAVALGIVTGLVLTSITEVGLASGPSQESFWIFFALTCSIYLARPGPASVSTRATTGRVATTAGIRRGGIVQFSSAVDSLDSGR
jgi:hypothetical protein